MRRFCDTEEFGTEYHLSVDDQRAMKIAEETTRRLTIGYGVPIIWRESEPHLDNNLQLAENIRQPGFERDYRKSIEKNTSSHTTESTRA